MKLEKWLLWLLLAGTIFLAFFKLGAASLNEWDESRRLLNALGMIRHHDYFNYYYLQIYDYWNAKPFLNTWVICINFGLFGVSELSLRLHSAIASVVSVLVLYLLLRRYKSASFAIICCMSLLASKAIFGFHLGRTGDQDAMLIMFMLLSLYGFTAYIDFEKGRGLWLGTLFLGFAFLTKSFVSMLFLPGIFLYAAYRNRLRKLFLDYRLYFAILSFALIIAAYYLLVKILGYEREVKAYAGNDIWETHIWYDFVKRFFEPGLESVYDPFLAFKALDIYYGIWIYVLYLGAIIIGIFHWKRLKKIRLKFSIDQPNILYLSGFIAFPILLLFSLSQNQRVWYFAPAFPMLAILTTAVISWFLKRWSVSLYPFLAVFAISLGLQVNWMAEAPSSTKSFFYSQSVLIAEADSIITDLFIPQDHVAYINMFNPSTFIYDVGEVNKNTHTLFYLNLDRAKERKMHIVSTYPPYCFAKY